VGKGPLGALLAITDLQFTLLKEQGLSTEFTLNGSEGVSLLCEEKIVLHSHFLMFCLLPVSLIVGLILHMKRVGASALIIVMCSVFALCLDIMAIKSSRLHGKALVTF
jgi:positive regulator of sigma E activity